MVFHCMNMPQFSSPVLYCGFWTFTFTNEILQRITMYVKSFHKYQLIISLLQNNQGNSVPGNEVTRECHGKLPWLKSTPSVQNLSLDVNAFQFRHFRLIGQVSSCEASSSVRSLTLTEITYYKQESPGKAHTFVRKLMI